MFRTVFAAAALAFALAAPANAQQFQLFGVWHCTVNAQSNDPARNYGLEVDVEIAPGGQLFARGVVIYPQIRNSIQNVEGYGDWTVLPPDAQSNTELLKLRMHPQNHAIISWFVRPVGPGRMYNLFHPPAQNGVNVQVETQCGKTG